MGLHHYAGAAAVGDLQQIAMELMFVPIICGPRTGARGRRYLSLLEWRKNRDLALAQ
jgi:hypothetical protein